MTIDINADVGEGIGNETQLMRYLSSCNIACGGHAGNDKTMQDAVRVAISNKVKIGAHPSFPDTTNFGRKPMPLLSHDDLLKSLIEQVRRLEKKLNNNKVELYHIKPHGALYNLAATDIEIASVLVKLMNSVSSKVKLVVPFGSVIEKLALQNAISIIYEAFADRNYNDDYTLVSRTNSNALLTNPESVFKHTYFMYATHNVKTITENSLPIKANTFCVHGDNENALEIVKHLSKRLLERNITIQKLE